MTRRRKTINKKLEELSNNPESERRLRGHEIIRLLSMGRIMPGEYRYEIEYMDGSVEVETFRVDKNGRIRDLKIRIEHPNVTESETRNQERKRR